MFDPDDHRHRGHIAYLREVAPRPAVTDRTKFYGSGSLAISVITTVTYVVLIAQQGEAEWAAVSVFVFVMLVIIVSTALATWDRPPIGFMIPIVLASLVGVLGIFSIGVPFLVAAALAFMVSREAIS